MSSCISFTNNYHSWRGGDFPTLFKNITVENMATKTVYVRRAVQCHPNGGQFAFARSPARTPHVGPQYVW